MKTIILFIQNPILKMTVIRTLMKNRLYYVEASNIDELFIKLDLTQNAGLLIQDYVKEKEADVLEALFKANLQSIPVVWVMPVEINDQVPDIAKGHITDILLSPFQPNTLLRKIKGILHSEDNKSSIKKNEFSDLELASNHRTRVEEAIKAAAKGRYPLCIIRIQILDAFMELNLKVLDGFKHVLRQSDQIMEVDLGEFIVLCPHTPQQSIKIVEKKIKDALDRILQSAVLTYDFHLYSANFPEHVQSYSQLENLLFNRKDNS